ncbi:glycosyltransferase family 66 protein [Tilletiaria anomala UBC 951]|uniref:Dolichyl-diphosphooligosaccharide--protein glycosyltransferase subunit STT3 n=1 Tax=Tilletiaria anomala (strain ATCC 24038 / CBS 436.72 / UBC 951) TaxID=1037660 RepID=A0A066W2Z2_TILAU|nr:glycosyltransferase family 66 protein [Tilletiaria anomala UBC 951]KDN45444.1 glycosyltransferase family 66 protein [Tilletiaria anomala UBC 951]
MGLAYKLPDMSIEATRNVASLLRLVIIFLIAGAAISSRLFAVVRHESIIHEFDPWFNFRATKVLAKDGYYRFWNWFDPTAWYPLGRAAGGTVYPGLMVTSGLIHDFLKSIHIPVDIRNICVLLAPAFSGMTAWATYMFTATMKDDAAGLLAAAFIGIAPGYISRSVAGSYDNEAIAIFLLMMTFYLWIKAMKEGSAMWGTACALFYFYMVAAWGGYVFITNMIPLHVFVLILMGRYNAKLYVAYSSWYAVGTLASMQVPFVGFLPVRTSEHMAALGVFGLLQLVAFVELVRSHVPSQQFKLLLRGFIVVIFASAFGALVALTYGGYVAPWAGRFYSLWDTGYAKKHIPIIASVSEHQPPAWPAFFFDLEMLIFLFPAGVYLLFRELRDEHVFVIIYSVMASYFASVMVRLMLTLTPVVCVTAAITISSLLETYLDPKEPDTSEASVQELTEDSIRLRPSKNKKSGGKSQQQLGVPANSPAPSNVHNFKGVSESAGVFGLDTRLLVSLYTLILLLVFVLHCTFVTSTAYSSPSVVLASRNPDGSQHIIDDFREAYYWLRQNTPVDSKVMSWWDYGYQIAGMADRPTLVDNNTWNNTHIATVGKAMSSPEDKAYPILKKHDVDYVLIIFGGLLGFSGDDINKYLWMIRIAQGVWPNEIREADFFTPQGQYKIDDGATPTMKNSLMFKMSYYRFHELFGGRPGMDRVRGSPTVSTPPTLDILDEAFTSENWIVRIYQVKKDDPLGRDIPWANSFNAGKRRKKLPPATAPKGKKTSKKA